MMILTGVKEAMMMMMKLMVNRKMRKHQRKTSSINNKKMRPSVSKMIKRTRKS